MTMELADAKGMKTADETAIQGRGIPSGKLMETAAGHIARAAAELAGDEHTAAVFCGPGNNGGDGVAAARILMDMGFQVRAFLVGSREKMTEDTRAMERELQSAGGALEPFGPDNEDQRQAAARAGVLVDALFGIGLKRELAGDALAAVEMMNGAGRPIVSADIPSGVSADGCGIYAIHREDLALPVRKPLTHKGDYGKLLIVAGSTGYTGAAALCAEGAVRAGAGLVYLGVPADIYEIAASWSREAMAFPLRCNDRGRVSRGALGVLRERLEVCGACVIGPGLGRDKDTAAVTGEVLRRSKGPVVADADALWAISRDLRVLEEAQAPVVLTPHEGEFARLLGRPVEDRLTDAMSFSKTYGCAVVLKGYRTICAFPDGKAYIIDAGDPGMATGGSGDVLAGVIGGLLGQLTPRRAVVTACWLHARAGDIAAEELGQYALKAGDIAQTLYKAEKEIIR